MDPASFGVGLVSLTFQLFSGCVKGYQLLSEAHGMPQEFQYLRVRIKTEQYRLLDWAHIANLDERDEGLLISNASKGLLIDVLDQQQGLLARFGRFDEKYEPLRRPLISDYPVDEQGKSVIPGPTSEPPNGLSRSDSSFQRRFPQSEGLLKKSLEWTKSTRHYPKRLAWASWDKQKVEMLIMKLTALNDFLRELLNTNQIQSLHTKQTRTEFQIMQLNSQVAHLVQIFESAMSMQSPNVKGPVDQLGLFMQARGYLGVARELSPDDKIVHLAALAQTKALNRAIEDDAGLTDSFARDLRLSNKGSQIKDVELSRTSIQLLDKDLDDQPPESHRVEAYYTLPGTHNKPNKRQVWIEWKTYDPTTFNGGPDAQVQERIRKLAALLKENNRSEDFHMPHCLGYFRDFDAQGEDHYRFGLVFEKPKGVHSSTRPVSLLDLLRDPSAEMPSLTDRITLMQAIAECIERLHAVNWLHKGLRSNNILFFCEHGRDATSPTAGPGPDAAADHLINDIDFSKPYISGFDYSRPAQNEDMTEKPPENAAYDLYRHPRVQGSGNRDAPHAPAVAKRGSLAAHVYAGNASGYKKSYDLYSLGVIMLEIAHWKPIDEILGIPNLQNARPRTTLRVKDRLLDPKEKILGHVKSHLGNRVEGVVSACLEGPRAFGLDDNEDERLEEVGARLQKGFYDIVVKKLSEMVL